MHVILKFDKLVNIIQDSDGEVQVPIFQFLEHIGSSQKFPKKFSRIASLVACKFPDYPSVVICDPPVVTNMVKT